eukprot:gene7121-7335_t
MTNTAAAAAAGAARAPTSGVCAVVPTALVLPGGLVSSTAAAALPNRGSPCLESPASCPPLTPAQQQQYQLFQQQYKQQPQHRTSSTGSQSQPKKTLTIKKSFGSNATLNDPQQPAVPLLPVPPPQRQGVPGANGFSGSAGNGQQQLQINHQQHLHTPGQLQLREEQILINPL